MNAPSNYTAEIPSVTALQASSVFDHGPPAIKKANQKVNDLVGRHTKERAALEEAEGLQESAAEADVTLHAEAIGNGKGDPGTPNADEVRAAIDGHYRACLALTQAITTARQETLDLVSGEAGRKWIKDMAKELGAETSELHAIVDDLTNRWQRIHKLKVHVEWLKTGALDGRSPNVPTMQAGLAVLNLMHFADAMGEDWVKS